MDKKYGNGYVLMAAIAYSISELFVHNFMWVPLDIENEIYGRIRA